MTAWTYQNDYSGQTPITYGQAGITYGQFGLLYSGRFTTTWTYITAN